MSEQKRVEDQKPLDAAGKNGMRFLRICRNPHEPFYWDADTPDESCPGQGCESGPHETWVPLEALQAAESALSSTRTQLEAAQEMNARLTSREAEQRLVAKQERDRAESAESQLEAEEKERDEYRAANDACEVRWNEERQAKWKVEAALSSTRTQLEAVKKERDEIRADARDLMVAAQDEADRHAKLKDKDEAREVGFWEAVNHAKAVTEVLAQAESSLAEAHARLEEIAEVARQPAPGNTFDEILHLARVALHPAQEEED